MPETSSPHPQSIILLFDRILEQKRVLNDKEKCRTRHSVKPM